MNEIWKSLQFIRGIPHPNVGQVSLSDKYNPFGPSTNYIVQQDLLSLK